MKNCVIRDVAAGSLPLFETAIVLKNEKYPYLLKDFRIVRAGQVYSTDIEYVRLEGGIA